MQPHNKKKTLTFSLELQGRVGILEAKGWSRRELSELAGLSPNSISQIIATPDSQPRIDTVLAIVQMLNDQGVYWSLDDAMVAAGMKPMSEVGSRHEFADPLTMGAASFTLPMFDAELANELGLTFGSKIAEVAISTTQLILKIANEYVLVETIGEAFDDDYVIGRYQGKLVMMSLADALQINELPGEKVQMVGKVVGSIKIGSPTLRRIMTGEMDSLPSDSGDGSAS